ncbi:MAG: asparaginase [Ramlibacter sp.]|nr:asparaginase [Ramlibacter sp.]
MSAKKIVVLGTGGTIAGTAAQAGDNIGYTAAQVGVEQLLAALPQLRGQPVQAEQVAQIDSKDMTPAVWQQLAQRCQHWLAQDDVRGVVITHGTDTLEETAYFLHAALQPSKPVVLTCAMRPSTALAPDGPQNLLDAVAVAAWPGAAGVVAVCAGTVHGATDVQKVHTYRLDAFSSGDAGPLGYVEEGAVRLVRNWPVALANRSSDALNTIAANTPWPRVEIVMSHAGAGGRLVQALVAQKVDGIVVAGTGNGSLHQELEAALLEAQAQGIRVVCASRCPSGRVLPKPADAFRDSEGLSPVKARIALMLALMG